MNENIRYTREQLDIELLKQKNDHFYDMLRDLKQKSESHFIWIMGSISVLYVSLLGILVAALAKSFKWF